MKRITILFLFVAPLAFSQNWVSADVGIEAGLMPLNDFVYDSAPQVPDNPEIYYWTTDAELQFADGLIFVGGELTTTTYHDEGVRMGLLYGEYEFSAGLRYKGFEVGFRHWCGFHPFHTYANARPDWEPATRAEGAYEQVYARIELKWGKE